MLFDLLRQLGEKDAIFANIDHRFNWFMVTRIPEPKRGQSGATEKAISVFTSVVTQASQ